MRYVDEPLDQGADPRRAERQDRRRRATGAATAAVRAAAFSGVQITWAQTPGRTPSQIPTHDSGAQPRLPQQRPGHDPGSPSGDE